DYGTDIIAPDNPTREGYTFSRWDPDIPEIMPAEDMTITAQWTINSYTITFNSNGGTAVDSITQDYSTDIAAPTYPTREGYTFNGWLPDIPSDMPAKDMTLTAQWTVRTYQVIFLNWDGTPLSTEAVPYGGTATPPAAPTRKGYTFTGWSQDYNNITGELVLGAQFTKNAPVSGENNLYFVVSIILLLSGVGLCLVVWREKNKIVTTE
ncbi:MAG TPA: InlB B-repeat-containing protein, partial [Clostridia bacterium]|nr:InlB B-repeat-containing protein [Clostridia bacterium]